MKTNKLIAKSTLLIAFFALASAQAGTTQLSNSPLSGASSVSIQPNILFMLDDSGSMQKDYLPDWAGDVPDGTATRLSQSKNSGFNGVYYNPATQYKVPAYFNTDNTLNTTLYPSKTSANTSAWTQVTNDGYGVQEPLTNKSSLVGNAYYYTTVAGEYCTNRTLKNCVAATSATVTYPFPAPLRWCKTYADSVAATPTSGACQATQIDPNPVAAPTNTPYNYPRIPSPRTSIITISGSSSTSISDITVDSLSILSTAVVATTLPATLAINIESSINACTYGIVGNCQVVGYSAVATGSTVTITAPGATGSAPAITKIGSMTVSATAFARPAANLAPGENLLTVIVPSTVTYTRPTTRKDCATEGVCTYAEEMTNFSNWWAYYRTRMQTMKTATSLSFEDPGLAKFRVGYATINRKSANDFQNVASFEGAQKKTWFDKVFAAIPASSSETPLRIALSDAGRLYSGNLNGTSIFGISVVDPVQFYCQQNVTILSTDGYWNQGSGYKMDGTTPVGEQDGTVGGVALEERPQFDGGAPYDTQSTLQNRKTLTPTTATWVQKKTEQLKHKTAALETRTKDEKQSRTSGVEYRDAIKESRTSQLQFRLKNVTQINTRIIDSRTSTLQTRSGPRQQATKDLEYRDKNKQMKQTSQLQKRTGQRQSKTYQLQQRLTQVQTRTSSNGGTSWTSWSNVASCSPVTTGTNRTQCQTLAVGGWNNAASCSVNPGTTTTSGGTDGTVTTYNTKSECQYTNSGWTNAPTCTPASFPLPSDFSAQNPVECQTSSWGSWGNAATCDASVTGGVECQYLGWSAAVADPSCSVLNQSSGPSYTVGLAVQCPLDWADTWTASGASCTSSATRQCQYVTDWSAWSDNGTCSTITASSGPSYSAQRKCQTDWSTWADATTSCTPSTTGVTRRECAYTAWSGYAADATCPGSAIAQSTTSTKSVLVAKECRDQWTGWTNTGPGCVIVPGSVDCQTTWSGWANATSTCDAVTDVKECQYLAWTGWGTDNTCPGSAAAQSGGPSYTQLVAKQCQQVTFPTTWTPTSAQCDATATRQCQNKSWSSWSADATCPGSAVAQSSGPSYPAGGAKECRVDWTAWSAAGASCDAVTNSRECRYAAWSASFSNTATCTETPQTSGPSYTPAETCQTVTVSDWGPALPASSLTDPPPTISGISCADGTVAGLTTSCRNLVPNPSLPIPVAACLGEAADASNGFIEKTCDTSTTGPTASPGGVCTAVTATAGNAYTTTTCGIAYNGSTPDTLSDVAEYYWKTDLRDPSNTPNRCTGGPLSDGTTTNVCTNDVKYPKQIMTTFTLGLGASGLMQYDPNYEAAASGDFYSVKTGEDATLGNCPWQRNGVCNWPAPQSDKQSNIDDLWHAAVNGRGKYFSASDPTSLSAGITGALHGIDAKEGSLTAVTVTSPNLVAGDNGVFEISFKAGDWSGDLVKRTIDGTTGAISATIEWSAQAQLDAKVLAGTHTARTIYTYNPAVGTDNLKAFLWSNLTSGEADYFKKPNVASLSQFCAVGTTCLAAATQALAVGEPLFNFVRGDKSHEGTIADLSAYYRTRPKLLGDIVGSEAVYVKESPWNYADDFYSAFKTANKTRIPMVYVGANDGMLHAFYAASTGINKGTEAWAYVPKIVMPNLYKLADKDYAATAVHKFFVDGTPSMGDICATNPCAAASDWKTILVGGLNNGGRGYYALDVTDPEVPKALWEFTDDNLGYSYGNPVITKLKDGTWVVLVTSGYNNVSPGDGKGYLFVLNANTGTLIRSISTNVGDTGTPSGLARIAAWANFPDSNNTSQRVYGGDLLGNLWRFDINGDIPVAADPKVYVAHRLATLKDASGVAQPITSKPELGKIKNNEVVFVATGQLLGADDLANVQRQSVYAIKDSLSSAEFGSPRPLTPAQTTPPPGNFVAQTMTSGTCAAGNAYCTTGESIVSVTNNPVDFNTKDGWYTDFPVAGERVDSDLRLQLGTLAFNTNTPKSGACVPVGVSFAYFLDYRSGSYVEGTNGLAGLKLGDYLSTAPSVIRLQDGSIKELIRTDAPGTISKAVPTAPTLFGTRRVSWRELVTE